MTRASLVREVAKEDGRHTIAEIDEILRYLELVIVRALAGGEAVKMFTGFSLLPVRSEGRPYVNPQTGRSEVSRPSLKCRLKTTPSFRERLNAMAV